MSDFDTPLITLCNCIPVHLSTMAMCWHCRFRRDRSCCRTGCAEFQYDGKVCKHFGTIPHPAPLAVFDFVHSSGVVVGGSRVQDSRHLFC
jgi:hypothetical protein